MGKHETAARILRPQQQRGDRVGHRRRHAVAAAEAAISSVHVPELEESSIPPVPEVEGAVAPEVREVTAPDLAAPDLAGKDKA